MQQGPIRISNHNSIPTAPWCLQRMVELSAYFGSQPAASQHGSPFAGLFLGTQQLAPPPMTDRLGDAAAVPAVPGRA